jgi:hypothetical protein
MITLDRIKLTTDKKYIRRLDVDVTTTVMKNNKPYTIRYEQKIPYNLFISYSVESSKCIIEFSGKLLGDKYLELINVNNIHNCFDTINSLGFCELDAGGIIADSNVISCDITTDIAGITMPDKTAIKACFKSLNKFQVQKYGNSGHVISKQVKTNNRKIRLSIYDKGKELRKRTNTPFLGMVKDKAAMLEYFNGRFRLEANVRTVQQIKDLLLIETNEMLDVLNSNANALLTLFDEVFDFPEEPTKQLPAPLSYPNLRTIKNVLLLEACEFDMEKVELVLATALSPNTNKRKYRAELKKLLNTVPQQNRNVEVMKKIRATLEAEESHSSD